MKNTLVLLLVILLLQLTVSSAETTKDQKSKVVVTKQLIDHELKEQALQTYEKRIIDSQLAQENRLDDIYGTINLLGYLAAFLGALITLVVVFFSLRSSTAAVQEAKGEANKIIESWIKDKGEQLLVAEAKAVISQQVDKALKEIKAASTPLLLALDAELQKTTKINSELTKNGKNEGEKDEPSQQLESVSTIGNEGLAEEIVVIGQPLPSEDSKPNYTKPNRVVFRNAQKLLDNDRTAEAIVLLEDLKGNLENSDTDMERLLYLDVGNLLAKISNEKLERPEQAIDQYKNLIEKFKDTDSPRVATLLIRSINDLALIYQSNNLFEQAVETYRNAITLFDKIQPKSSLAISRKTRAYNGIAKCLAARGKNESIIELFNEYKEKAKSNPGLYAASLPSLAIRAANAYINLNKIDLAKELLISEIDIPVDTKGNHAGEKLLLAQIYEDESKYEQALSLCNEVIQQYSQSKMVVSFMMQALTRKASILSKQGVIFEELRTYDQIINLWEKSEINKDIFSIYAATASVNKAITLANSGEPAMALNEAAKVIDLFRLSLDRDIVEQTTKAAKLKVLLER